MAKKILIAEDDKAVSDSLKAILEKYKYRVITAFDGEECLKKIISDKPDLVILDIIMPKVDGYGFLVSMKEVKASAGDGHNIGDIPVIVVTARGDELVRDLVGKENIQAYITKPYDVEQLLAKIKEVLKE